MLNKVIILWIPLCAWVTSAVWLPGGNKEVHSCEGSCLTGTAGCFLHVEEVNFQPFHTALAASHCDTGNIQVLQVCQENCRNCSGGVFFFFSNLKKKDKNSMWCCVNHGGAMLPPSGWTDKALRLNRNNMSKRNRNLRNEVKFWVKLWVKKLLSESH